MEFLKLIIITFFTFQALLPAVRSRQPPSAAAATKTNLFRIYIGAGFKDIHFSDVPIRPDVEFHFMLAFAVDCTAATSSPSGPSPTDGIFNVFWDKETLTPDGVSAIKNANNNVKVVLSIGGDSCGKHAVKFNATSVDSWVSNAVTSLTKIITDYNLDGIDIDYEQYIADPNTFSECIGQLVTQLKLNGTISIASIAPYDDDAVQAHYEALWKSYAHVFDYVNFQFYAYDKGTSFSLFMEYFDRQRETYEGGNMVVGFATDETAGGLSTGDGFFDACKKLKSQGKLAGIFVWSADDSKASGFSFENQAQSVLAGDITITTLDSYT